MPNVTLRVPDELYLKMRKHREIRWSEVARRAIAGHIERLEGAEGEVKMEELDDVIRKSGVRLDKIPWEKAVKHYEKMRELEWKRTYSIRAPS